ncbi:hypothetical protein AAFF_G00357240 [Aldrovandia affinis]|uniref:Uncharacterized protein n=1 Tax=Aldrovandia affinis TaxID=143900 RepID=A0AAD7TA90_9TELE|nr:hypothetical protein AAFF_G00357240 [Aldrovandia affinis]
MLQSPLVELAKAVDLVKALLDTLQEYRDEYFFGELWREVEDTARNCDVSVETVAKRQQKTSRRLYGSIITFTTGDRRGGKGDMEGFRRDIFYPVLDSMIGELQRRFSKPNCNIMKGI